MRGFVRARSFIPGINIGEGAILGLGSVATHDLEPFGIYAGMPAKKVKERLRSSVPEASRYASRPQSASVVSRRE